MKFNTIVQFLTESKKKILVVGDIFLDEYLYGKATKISPEKPVPVFQYNSSKFYLGGAGNVVDMLANLEVNVGILGLVGIDKNANEIKKILNKKKYIQNHLIFDKNYKTIKKTRILSDSNHIVRLDYEDLVIKKDLSLNIVKKFKKLISNYDCVIFSDYKKGTLEHIKELIQISKRKNIFTLVDPKQVNLEIYKDANIIKPNFKEYKDYLIFKKYKDSESTFLKISKKLCKSNFLVTMGKDGLMYNKKSKVLKLNTKKQYIYDVTGAGDLAISILAICAIKKIDIDESSLLINSLCSSLITKTRDYKINMIEVYKILNHNINKFNNLENSIDLLNILKKLGKKIVFTNGCFDIFHTGHLNFLETAKTYGDFLIVAINSDYSTSINKGKNRPINKFNARLKILEMIGFIDFLVEFNEKTPIKLIRKIKPSVLCKGNDYKLNEIVGADFIKSYGGKIKRIKFKNNKSTTKIYQKIIS